MEKQQSQVQKLFKKLYFTGFVHFEKIS